MFNLKLNKGEEGYKAILSEEQRRHDIEQALHELCEGESTDAVDGIVLLSKMCNTVNELAFYLFMFGGFVQECKQRGPIAALLRSISQEE